MAGLHVVTMILWHSVPLEVMAMGVFYCCSQGYTTSAHGLRLILVQNESTMVKIGVDM